MKTLNYLWRFKKEYGTAYPESGLMFSDVSSIHTNFSWGLVQSCRLGNNKHPYSAMLPYSISIQKSDTLFSRRLTPT